MRRCVFALLSLCCLATLPAAGQQQPTETVKVNATSVNLRKGASVDSGVVRALAKGTLLTVLSRDANWVKVQVQGQTASGWVRSDLVDSVPASAAAAGTPAGAAPARSNAVAPPPPPPAAGTPTTAVPPPPPAKMTAAPKSPGAKDDSYHSGFTLFGGITSFTATLSPNPGSLGNASGFEAGIGVIAHLGGPIGLELDAAYVQGGYAETVLGMTETLHDNNAGGAILLRPAFGSGPVRFFLLGGANVAYLINCTYTTTDPSAPPACKVSASQNRTDYGAVVGGGISFGPIAVQVRYDIGIANLSNTAGTTVKSKGLVVLGSLIL